MQVFKVSRIKGVEVGRAMQIGNINAIQQMHCDI